jgi:hypothetical protein
VSPTPCPPKGGLRFNHLLFVWTYSNVEMEEQKVWNCITATLLIQMEKEMEDEISYIATIDLLLRRTLVL